MTITPARGPIVLDEWISPGTHIAAVGADKGGDQELDPRILQRARIFVDDIRQCRNDGEINVPLAQGLISEDDIAGEIGEVVQAEAGTRRPTRRSRSSTQRGSPSRTRPRCRSSMSARSRPASGSRRR